MPGPQSILERSPQDFVVQCKAHGDVGQAASFDAADALLDQHLDAQHADEGHVDVSDV